MNRRFAGATSQRGVRLLAELGEPLQGSGLASWDFFGNPRSYAIKLETKGKEYVAEFRNMDIALIGSVRITVQNRDASGSVGALQEAAMGYCKITELKA